MCGSLIQFCIPSCAGSSFWQRRKQIAGGSHTANCCGCIHQTLSVKSLRTSDWAGIFLCLCARQEITGCCFSARSFTTEILPKFPFVLRDMGALFLTRSVEAGRFSLFPALDVTQTWFRSHVCHLKPVYC